MGGGMRQTRSRTSSLMVLLTRCSRATSRSSSIVVGFRCFILFPLGLRSQPQLVGRDGALCARPVRAQQQPQRRGSAPDSTRHYEKFTAPDSTLQAWPVDRPERQRSVYSTLSLPSHQLDAEISAESMAATEEPQESREGGRRGRQGLQSNLSLFSSFLSSPAQ